MTKNTNPNAAVVSPIIDDVESDTAWMVRRYSIIASQYYDVPLRD